MRNILTVIFLIVAGYMFGDNNVPKKGVETVLPKPISKDNAVKETSAEAALSCDSNRASDWFDESLLRCSFLVRPNPESLGGRYFVIARSNNLNEFGYVKTRQNLHQLRMMGVTDIIQLLIKGSSTYFPSADKDAKYRYFNKEEGGYDALMTLVEAAAAEKIGIWCKLQLPGDPDGLELNKEFQATRPDGTPYLYLAKTTVPDVSNAAYRQFLKRMIDIFAEKYNKRGSFKGFYIDMPFTNGGDMMAKRLDDFKQFCEERFNEMPPMEDIAEKLKREDIEWTAPNDKWWRRFVLFKQWTNEDFIKDISSYCESKGFKFGLQLNTSVDAWRGWWQGHDPCRLSKYADWVWMYPGMRRYEPCYIMKRSIPGTFTRTSVARAMTESFRGQFAGVHVFFATTMELPVLYGTSPRVLKQVERNILNTREWAGAKSLTKVGILYNHNSMLLKALPKEIERDEYLLMDRVGRYLDIDRVFTDLVDFYANYNVLIVTRYSADCLPDVVMDKLKAFIQNGGTVITLGSNWSTAKVDLTDPKDITEELTGIPACPMTGSGKLEVFEKAFGKGRVITIKSPDIYQALKDNNAVFERDFAALLRKYAAAPVTIDNDPKNPTDKQIIAMTTLQKNNWVGVSLFPDQDYPVVQQPVTAKVKVDMEKLGVSHNRFRVMLLKRDMELLKEVINRDERSWTSPMPRGKGMDYYWSAADLKEGVDIAIIPDNEFAWRAPEKVNVPPNAKYMVKSLYHNFPQAWTKNAAERNYMYEIMVVAPADELNIDGEKIDADKSLEDK